MRYISLVLLSLLLVFKAGAQNTFSQKDFNKLLPLTREWEVTSPIEDHAFEHWERLDDSTLQGNIYRSTDTGISPITYVQLKLRNQQIYFEHTSFTDDAAKTHILQLSSILKNEFLFEYKEQTNHIIPKNQGEKIPFRQSYFFGSEKEIVATFQWHETSGLKTIRYRFSPADK